MLHIKIIEKGHALNDRSFFSIGEAAGFFYEKIVHAFFLDYVLIINGRRYEWPEHTHNVLELEDHISHCVDMDESFYD